METFRWISGDTKDNDIVLVGQYSIQAMNHLVHGNLEYSKWYVEAK